MLRITEAVFFILAVACLFVVNAQEQAKPKTTPVPESEKAAFEKIVHDYLLTHPEIIREAIEALRAKEDAQKKEETSANIKRLASEIYLDPDAPVLGNPKGDVTVVVFFDYFCGYCRKTMPELQDLTVKDPGLKIVFKQFPILGPGSIAAAKAALAAERQGKFAAFHRAMLASDSADDRAILSIAEHTGLDYAKLQKDMAEAKTADMIARNLTLAASLNIMGTPAYLVGDQFIPGAISAGSLEKIIAAQRATNRTAAPKTAVTGQK